MDKLFNIDHVKSLEVIKVEGKLDIVTLHIKHKGEVYRIGYHLNKYTFSVKLDVTIDDRPWIYNGQDITPDQKKFWNALKIYSFAFKETQAGKDDKGIMIDIFG